MARPPFAVILDEAEHPLLSIGYLHKFVKELPPREVSVTLIVGGVRLAPFASTDALKDFVLQNFPMV